ncbi:MAG: GntR family transcriptional regulator [Gemmatimonadota bacterium]|jgi:DNA-binding GntR family transcriptional regulator
MSHSQRQKRHTDRGTRAYERLRQLIVHGQLAPGAWIIESDVADRLGLSRTPVRAALQRLHQEGYVTITRRGRQARAAVAPLTREDARELFGMVGAIEAFTAARTAELPDGPRAAAAETLAALNGALAEAAAASRPEPARIFDLDMTFHRHYVEVGGGPRTIALHDAIKPQSERYIRLYTSALIDEIGTSVKEHEAIVDAVRRGDVDAARDGVRINWANASGRLSGVIDTHGEKGSW